MPHHRERLYVTTTAAAGGPRPRRDRAPPQTFDVPDGEAFAFATVHGAGHEVPTFCPEAALKLFKNYLAGEYY